MQRYKRAISICRSLKQGAGVHNACRAANTSVTAFYNWRREKPKFDKFIQTIYDCRTANVVDALYKGALEGNPTCMIFWLKNKAGWKDSPLIDQSQHHTLQIVSYGEKVDNTNPSRRLQAA